MVGKTNINYNNSDKYCNKGVYQLPHDSNKGSNHSRLSRCREDLERDVMYLKTGWYLKTG